jgi:hypothetical protein
MDVAARRATAKGGGRVDDGPLAHHVAGFPSGLTDRERTLLLRLAIWNLCRQTGTDEQTAADALDHFTARGEVTIEGDGRDVYLKVCGHVHIHAERAWLRVMAHRGAFSLN